MASICGRDRALDVCLQSLERTRILCRVARRDDEVQALRLWARGQKFVNQATAGRIA